MERIDGRGGACLAPALAAVHRPAMRGADACRCSPLRVIDEEQGNDWATALQSFVLADQAACKPSPQHPEHARTVTHRGRRETLHDYNTL